MDLLAPIGTVLASGYDGPLSLEIFNPGYRERDTHEVARAGAVALGEFIDELGTQANTQSSTWTADGVQRLSAQVGSL